MLKDTFCSSPWFHLRINPQGQYLPCRWDFSFQPSNYSIANTSVTEYLNSPVMTMLRSQILNGEEPETCRACRYEDLHDKVSGRQRQLLKSAINIDQFDKTLCASPHWQQFKYSYDNHGYTTNQPVDLQIDLGNTCNSACIMCTPAYSSRLISDYKKLHEIEPILFQSTNNLSNWTDDPVLVDKFVNDLSEIPNIKYIHFLGGETLYLKSFYDICNRLISNGTAKNISLGTTTNCTVITPELEYIIQGFKHVHIGLSIEAIHPVNDYIRWPSKINDIIDNINKFILLREQTGLHLSLRITPNIFSIYHIDSIFEFMINNSITAESCNILQDPSCLRLELLPTDIIEKTIEKINQVISKHGLVPSGQTIVNRRRVDLVDPVITDVIFEYKHLLENYQAPKNIEEERYNLVKFTRAFESLRNNNILNYLPEYEEFLRSYGY
jgi:sulfatase maturation enzyme AslB (radical SAM superfamily)